MSGEEGFLSRWSRRKRAPEPDAAAEDTPAPPEAAAEAPAAPAPARAACPIPDVPEIDLASLPRIEELTADSDFGLFLRPGIPPVLRNAALKRMWSLDPAIRDYIGPVEYQWDFNAPGGLPFGFAGELAGDVGRLLAQAIGQVEKLAGDPPAPQPDSAEEAALELPAPPGPTAPEAEPEPSVPVATATPEHVDREPPSAARRRHGGALPG